MRVGWVREEDMWRFQAFDNECMKRIAAVLVGEREFRARSLWHALHMTSYGQGPVCVVGLDMAPA